jgi:uncharacterized protein YbjT (DUF2867 family)
MSRGVVAVTGATGFLGRHLVRTLAADGWSVRILARRDVVGADWADLEPQVVIGGLGDRPALARLCAGAAVVVHVAGLIKARSRTQFDSVNVEGAKAIAEAAAAAGSRMLMISSLAAREPTLSDYAASKRAGEDAARALIGEALTIVRPPAIYGPGDMETLELFRVAQASPWLPVLDPRARLALVHVEDAARQISDLAGRWRPGTFALSDTRTGGYSWREVMTAAAGAVGTRTRLQRIPDGVITTIAGLSGALSLAVRKNSIFTSGKAREMLHLDWSLSPAEFVPEALAPRYDIDSGFTQSVFWYRANGFLVA